MKKFDVGLIKPFMKVPDLMLKIGARSGYRKYIKADQSKQRNTGESDTLGLVSMRITDRCNHRCEACGQYGESGYNRDDNELPKVKDNGCNSL